MPKKKILFLISDTGGGHRASANSLKDEFIKQFPSQFEFEIIDILVDYSFWPLSNSPKTYALLSTKYPYLWWLLFKTQNIPFLMRFLMEFIAKFTYKKLLLKINDYNPDLIISVHPLAQQLTAECLKHTKSKISFIVVCSDLLSGHHLWFSNKCDAVFVACKELVTVAKKAQIKSENIYNLGLPVKEQFSKKFVAKKELRKKLGLDPELPVALVFGGGDGVGPIAKITNNLINKLHINGKALGQVVVLCGRNISLKSNLESHKWPVPTKFYGFVDNVAEIMNACNVLVTKAGPGSIAEGLICGLPIIIYGYIPGQEEGNIPFVTNARAGFFIKDPSQISDKVFELFSNPGLLNKLSINAKNLSSPNSTKDIVKTIYTRFLKS